MATFRGSNHQIGASAAWTNGDLANLINNLYRQSIRAGACGEYERGLRDMAQSIADATNSEIDLYPDGSRDRQVIDVHAERSPDRYAVQPAAIRVVEAQRPAIADMTGTEENVVTFYQARGRLSERQFGYVWVQNDTGVTAFWDKLDWELIETAEFRAWGEIVPSDDPPRHWILVRRTYAAQQRRQLAAPHASRITHQDRRLR